MADLPYMPLWTRDLKGDTGLLSNAEFGAYMRLLLDMWEQGGSLPDDERTLKRILHVNQRGWLQLKPALDPFLQRTTDGRLTQKRLAKVYAVQQQKRDNTAAAAAQRWHKGDKPLKDKKQTDANASNPHMQSQSHARSRAKPEPKEPTSPSEFGSGAPLPPGSPRFASPPDAARSARPPVAESQAAFVQANRPEQSAAAQPPVSTAPRMQPPAFQRALEEGRPVPGFLGITPTLQTMPVDDAPASQPYQPPPKPDQRPVEELRAMSEDEFKAHLAEVEAQHEAERIAAMPKTALAAARKEQLHPTKPGTPALMAALKAKREEDERRRYTMGRPEGGT